MILVKPSFKIMEIMRPRGILEDSKNSLDLIEQVREIVVPLRDQAARLIPIIFKEE